LVWGGSLSSGASRLTPERATPRVPLFTDNYTATHTHRAQTAQSTGFKKSRDLSEGPDPLWNPQWPSFQFMYWSMGFRGSLALTLTAYRSTASFNWRCRIQKVLLDRTSAPTIEHPPTGKPIEANRSSSHFLSVGIDVEVFLFCVCNDGRCGNYFHSWGWAVPPA
jgi:hypothetical protein